MPNSGNFIPTHTECHRVVQGDVVVVIKVSDHRRPRYSYDVGFKVDDRTTRHRQVRWEGQGKISITRACDDVSLAVQDAEEWILEQYQNQEDAIVAEKEEKERKQLAKDKPKPQGGTHKKVTTNAP